MQTPAIGLSVLPVAMRSKRKTDKAKPGHHGHPPQDQFLHEKFYSTWRMPDKPSPAVATTPTATRPK